MDKPKADRRISDTVLYFYEGAFTLWRQRMAGICEEARKKGWRIQPVNVDIMTSNAKSVLDFWKPLGVIVDGGTLNRGGFAADSYAGIPAVFCDSDRMASGRETYCLRHDSESTARIAAKELLSLNSESLGFVSFHTPRDWSDTRRAVIEKVAAEDGVPFSAFDSVAACEGADIGVFLGRLSSFLLSLRRPAGILAANDEMAAHVLAAAASAGIAVPDELAADALDGPDARDAANLQALLRILLEMPAPICLAFWRVFWIEPKAPSASTIAALSGTAKRTVQRRLAELRRVHADHLFAVARGEG